MDTESVPENICEQVFERDGHRCWLCYHESTLHIAHQIDAAAFHPFYQFRANGLGTIPSSITNLAHPDNLFPFCANCHEGYDAAFPDWVLIPDKNTLQKYIDHENNYQQRYLISQKSPSSVPPRSLPNIDRSEILYHPLIITQITTKCYLSGDKNWPRHWLGEPTTTIHRAAHRGLFNSTSIHPMRLGHASGKGARQW